MCALRGTLGLRATMAMTLAAVCLFVVPAFAKTAAEEDAELTGVETAESANLDREADKLLEQSKKADAEAQALLARARGKIDPKAMADALKRGDRSVLFQTSPEEKEGREREELARKLKEQAHATARQAAEIRAHAAAEERCKAPAAGTAPANAGQG